MRFLRVLLLISFVAFASPAWAVWSSLTVQGDGGVPLHVVTTGKRGAPAILFIHGLGASHYNFKAQLDSDLAKDFFLVAFDLRGHGASGRPQDLLAYSTSQVWALDVAAVMKATGIQRPIIVAWSYGTWVAMDYVREYGAASVAGLNFTGGLGGLAPVTVALPSDGTPSAEGNPVADIESLFQFLPPYARDLVTQRQLDNRDLLDRVDVPVLLSLGERDFDPGMVQAGADLAKRKPNFRVSEYKGAGHSVFSAQPARFNDELLAFARQRAPAPP